MADDLREWIRQSNYSLMSIAKAAGIHRCQLCNFMSGKSLSSFTMDLVMEALGLRAELTRVSPPHPDVKHKRPEPYTKVKHGTQ